MGYLLILFLLLMGNVNTIVGKNYTKKSMRIKTANSIYILLAHPVAAIFFFIIAGGDVSLNLPTFLFSCAYGLVSIFSVILTFRAYRETNLVYMSVFSGAGSFIIPFFAEWLFWKVPFSALNFISVFLRITAIFIPLFFDKEKRKGLIVCMLLFCLSATSGLVTRAYTLTPSVLPTSSWFFWTNVVVLPMITIAVLAKEGPKTVASDVKQMKPVLFLLIIFATALSNVSSLISVRVIAMLGTTIYSIISSAMGMVLTILLSTLIFKEDIKKPTYISAALSVTAGIISVL